MAYRRNSNLRQLASALEKRADFLDDAKEWIYDNPELAAGILGGTLGAGGGALVPTEDGAGGRVRNALIGALLGGGLGAGAGYLGKDEIKDLMFGNGEKTRQFDKDLEDLTGKKFSGGKEVVDDSTQLETADQVSTFDQKGPLTLKNISDANKAAIEGAAASLTPGVNPSAISEYADELGVQDVPLNFGNGNPALIQSLLKSGSKDANRPPHHIDLGTGQWTFN